MTDPTGAKRWARYDQRQAKLGLKRVTEYVPEEREDEFRDLAKRMREEGTRPGPAQEP